MQPDCVHTNPERGLLSLWCAHPKDLTSEEAESACASLLSEGERAHWLRLKFERHRREYLTTRFLVRNALSRHHPLAPEAWRFQLNPYGKPSSDPECGLHFNLSNSPDLVVCLIARGAEVGVDVEPYKRADRITALAPEVLSPLEMAEFEALREGERPDRALSLWTLKEAYIKARGMGLSLPLKQFSFLFEGADGIRLALDPSLPNEPGRVWRFCLVEHADHRIALMVDSARPLKLEMWEMRPGQWPAARLPLDDVRWFPAS